MPRKRNRNLFKNHAESKALVVAKKALKIARGASMPLVEAIPSFTIQTVTASIPILVYLEPCVNPVYGNGVSQIKIHSYDLKIDMISPISGATIRTNRIDLIHDRKPNGATLTAAQFTTIFFGTATPGMTQYPDPLQSERFTLIKSQRYTCLPNTGVDFHHDFDWHVKVNKTSKIKTQDGDFEYANVTDNAYFLLFWTNDVTTSAAYANCAYKCRSSIA